MMGGRGGGSGRRQELGQPEAAPYTHGLGAILRDFFRHTKGFRYLIIFIVLGMAVDGLLQSGIVMVLKLVIDKLLADPVAFVRDDLARYALYGVAGALLFFPFAFSGHYVTAVVTSKLSLRYRRNLYQHLLKLSVDFFHQNKVGEVSARLTSDIENGVYMMVRFLMSSTWALSVTVTSVVTMFFLCRKMFLVFMGLQALVLVVSRIVLPRLRRLARDVRENIGELNAQVTEDITAFSLIKSFAREKQFFDQFRDALRRLYQAEVKAEKFTNLHYDILQVLFLFLAPIAILGTGSLMVAYQGLSIGTLIAFWGYWKLVQHPINTIFNSFTVLLRAMASMDRIMEFFNAEPLISDRPGARHLKISEGEVRFEHLDFTYRTLNVKAVIHDLSLTIPARSSFGIAGASGAGKTTLIQLLLRFYDPGAGRITIDGHDLRDLTQESLRSAIGVVMQDTTILSGTVRQNILLGREGAADRQVWQALERAGAEGFVRELEAGLDTILGERGVNLSGGQRQRLAIARVFLKDPPIVVFDEATSSLDTLTELKIQEAMQALLTDRTAIVIAHRLSTIVNCHQIMLLDRGRVLGVGAHDELIKKVKLYADLVRTQKLA